MASRQITGSNSTDAGFLVTDLTDPTGTQTLLVDYSGTFAGHEVLSVYFHMNGIPGERDYDSQVRYNTGTEEAPVLERRDFAVSSFLHLVFQGGAQNDIVYGAIGGDTIRGGGGDDSFYGRGGNDRFFGGDGDDRAQFGGLRGADRAFGGDGDDAFFNVGANDTIFGGAGTDKVWVNLRNQSQGLSLVLDDFATEGNLHGVEHVGLRLTAQNDALRVSHRYLMNSNYDYRASYDLGRGNDRLVIDFRENDAESLNWDGGVLTTYAVLPDGTISGELGKEVYFQGHEHLVLLGTDNADRIFGGGDATLHGAGGDDVIGARPYAAGNDLVLFGGDGNDSLSILTNGWSHGSALPGSTAFGGAGRDTLQGGSEDDLLSGDAGRDRILGSEGTDTLRGGAGADFLAGESADDLLQAGAGADSLYGGDSRDTLMGGAGNDLLLGEGSTDDLYGGAGNDTLSGGYNDDRLTGGAGNDVFLFEGERGTRNDVITDYEAGDSLHFGGGLTAEDIASAISGDDLLVSWNTGTVLVVGMAGQTVSITFDL